MIIKCWGARGSIPVSGKEYKKYGGDTTCLEIRTQNDDIVIIDAGTGIRRLGNRLVKEKRHKINIIFTHTHWDHVQGFPFFKPIFVKETRINIFGCPFSKKSVKEMIAPLLIHPYFPVSFEDIKAKIEYHSLGKESFSIGPLTITPILLNHPNQGLGYKFTEEGRSFVFLTDNELNFKHPGGLDFEDYVTFCSGADLLIHDAEYTEEDYKLTRGWGHSVYKEALRLAAKAGVKQFGLFHHNPDSTDESLDEILDDCQNIIKEQKLDLECFAARQNMEITFGKDQIPVITNDPPLKKEKAETNPSQEDIQELEDKLQQLQIEKEEDIQQAVAGVTDEASQLKSTITALRDELEKKQTEKEESVQQTKALFSNENVQLKETISAQRDTMTGNMITYEEKLQESKHFLQNESDQLKKTISVLREKLEELDGR